MIDYEMEKFRSLEKGLRKLLTHVRCRLCIFANYFDHLCKTCIIYLLEIEIILMWFVGLILSAKSVLTKKVQYYLGLFTFANNRLKRSLSLLIIKKYTSQLGRQLYLIQLDIFVSKQSDNLLFWMIILNTSRYTDHPLFKPIVYSTI